MDKDDRLKLAQYGLVCCEELDTMTGRELNQLKAAVTMVTIDERIPYERYPRHLPHIASFCGTGNNIQFLSDPTGNRRWLPFEVECIDPPQQFPIDYAGVYAQAYALYRQGFHYWFTQEEIQRLSRHNTQYETPNLERELIDQYFRRPTEREPCEELPVSVVLQIVGANITQKLSTVMLGRAFVGLGFRFRTVRGYRHYQVVRRSAEEMRVMRHRLPGGDGEDGGDET